MNIRLQCEVCLPWDSWLKSLKVLALGEHSHSVEKHIYQSIYGGLLRVENWSSSDCKEDIDQWP